MRDVWTPREPRRPEYERPFLEAPSPYGMPWDPPPVRESEAHEEEDAPRVIIIDP